MKVLVVDDHTLIRDGLRQVLTALDDRLELFEAASGAEALSAAANTKSIDLVLLDLGLPDLDGFDALAKLREQSPATPVVVLSASDDSGTVVRAIDVGAMGFIPKTSSDQVLINALRLVLSGGVYLPAEVLREYRGTPEHALQRAAEVAKGGAPMTPRELGLTGRQAEVLALMVQGKPNKLICRQLDISEGTVKIHVTAILKALNVTNRTQAVIAVGKLGLKLPQM